MADDPLLVSIVLTTFNRSDLVIRAADSVLHQTWQHLELIVVDDCSTDDTAQVLAQIRDPRLRTIRHERNLGLAEARNSGVREANGSYVAFLDDDDEWLPNKLATQVGALERHDDAGEILLFCQAIMDDGVSHDVRPARGMRPGEPLSEYLMCGEGVIVPSCAIATRSLVARTPFDRGRRRLEDYSWYLRLERQGVQFVLLEEPLAVWHIELRRERLSRVVSFEQADEWLDEYRDAVTPKARRAFLAREIAPFVASRHRPRALRAIAAAVATRSVTPKEGLKSLLKAVLPAGALYRLRHLLPRGRFG